MSDERDTLLAEPPISGPPAEPRRARSGGWRWRPRRRRRRIKKLRLALILLGLGFVALISTVFGMMMAVASDLPALETYQQYKDARNSELYDLQGHPLGILADAQHRILVDQLQISNAMKDAVIAVEDKRFFHNSGIDIRGIARALFADLTRQRAVQGASTITQQFVKNALTAENNRTIFEKLREAALAYHLTRKWSKEKILTEYLNTIYFGNGAYGVESAARTYWGFAHPGCGTLSNPCAALLTPPEAALLAGLISSPSGYDPISHPTESLARRNQVLRDMLAQHYIDSAHYQAYLLIPLPTAAQIQPPQENTLYPYFASWIRPQIVDRFGAQRAFNGGLRIQTTIDGDLQAAAEQAVSAHLGGLGPAAALVALDNRTGEVRAMVGGSDYQAHPFNLATQGERQPGSAIKVFTLALALREGVSPNSVWPSAPEAFYEPRHGRYGGAWFAVRNDESAYSGQISLANATAYSDNTVFARLGIQLGVPHIVALAHQMGIVTPLSENYAFTLGGLTVGVTPLEMAHAYQTIADHGQRVTGSLSDNPLEPSGIRSVTDMQGNAIAVDRPVYTRVLPATVANEETSLLEGVISYGTGTAAATGHFAAGKTGTTSNYADAWFVGFDQNLTVAVWVGYPDQAKSMKYLFNGKPVMGGTYPALIWHDFIVHAEAILAARQAAAAQARAAASASATQSSTSTSTTTTATPATGTSNTGTSKSGTGTPTSGQTGTGQLGGGQQQATPPAAPTAPGTQPKGPTTPGNGQTPPAGAGPTPGTGSGSGSGGGTGGASSGGATPSG